MAAWNYKSIIWRTTGEEFFSFGAFLHFRDDFLYIHVFVQFYSFNALSFASKVWLLIYFCSWLGFSAINPMEEEKKYIFTATKELSILHRFDVAFKWHFLSGLLKRIHWTLRRFPRQLPCWLINTLRRGCVRLRRALGHIHFIHLIIPE